MDPLEHGWTSLGNCQRGVRFRNEEIKEKDFERVEKSRWLG